MSKSNGVPAGMESNSEDSDGDSQMFSGYAVKTQLPNENKLAADGDCGRHNFKFNNNEKEQKNITSEVRQSVKMQNDLLLPTEEMRTAVLRGNLGVVQSIIQNGCPVDCALKSGWTALMYACSCGQPEIVQYLLEHHANANYHKDRFTPLMAACASSCQDEYRLLKCVTHLVQSGASVNSFERHHVTPLMFAAREGRTNIVKHLLEHGTDVNAKDNRGWTSLAWAVSRGKVMVVRMFLERHPSLDPPNDVRDLLQFAVSLGQNEIVAILEHYLKEKTLPVIFHTPNSSDIEESSVKLFNPRKDMKHYCGDLEMFFNGLSLSQLIPVFHCHQLSFADVLKLSDEDLIKIGISKLGERKKIMSGIRDIHLKEWKNTSLPKLERTFSCPEAACVVSNIAKHLNYIETTISYIRTQIQSQPRILELCQDVSNVHTLINCLDDSMKHNENLHSEMRFLKQHLNKVKDNVEYVPGDLIVERPDSHRYSVYKQRRGSILAITTTCLIGLAVASRIVQRPITFGYLSKWQF